MNHPDQGDAVTNRAGALPAREALNLNVRQAEAVVRLVESAPAVCRLHQFFVWTQGQVHPLLPHQVLVCGAYVRREQTLRFKALHSVVLSPALLGSLTQADGPLLRSASRAWVDGGGRAVLLDAGRLDAAARPAMELLAQAVQTPHLLVHGVARPQRPDEIESLFLLAGGDEAQPATERLQHADMVLPYLHATWRRVLAAEAELPPEGTPTGRGAATDAVVAGVHGGALTAREREILLLARDGRSNPQIGQMLGISALTVKNHIQKILRKLGARNRAHAVALAMGRDLPAPHDAAG